VLGDHRPAIRQYPRVALAGIDHRLNGEGHAFLQHHAFARPAVMQHLRLVVVDLADAVPTVLADHAEALRFGEGLDRVAHVAQGGAGPDHPDTAEHRLAGDLDQAPGQHRGLADVVHAAGIAVPAVLDHGDVDVDDVAVLQDLGVAGYAVADDVVDRGAHRLGEAAIADVGRDRALHVHDVVVADAVQLLGGHARLHVRGNDLEHLGGQAAGDAHLLDLFGGLEGNGHPRIIADPGNRVAGAGCGTGGRPLAPRLHQVAREPRILGLRICAPPTPGVTGEYTPAASARAGVPLERGSATEAAGRPNPGTIATARRWQPPHPVTGGRFQCLESSNAPDHHAPDAGSRRPFRPPDALLEPQDGPVHLRRPRQD